MDVYETPKGQDLSSYAYYCLQHELHADVTVKCDKEEFHTHRLVLAAASSYLKQILEGSVGKDTVLLLPDICPTDVRNLLELLYTGSVVINCDQQDSLLSLMLLLQMHVTLLQYIIVRTDETVEFMDTKVNMIQRKLVNSHVKELVNSEEEINRVQLLNSQAENVEKQLADNHMKITERHLVDNHVKISEVQLDSQVQLSQGHLAECQTGLIQKELLDSEVKMIEGCFIDKQESMVEGQLDQSAGTEAVSDTRDHAGTCEVSVSESSATLRSCDTSIKIQTETVAPELEYSEMLSEATDTSLHTVTMQPAVTSEIQLEPNDKISSEADRKNLEGDLKSAATKMNLAIEKETGLDQGSSELVVGIMENIKQYVKCAMCHKFVLQVDLRKHMKLHADLSFKSETDSYQKSKHTDSFRSEHQLKEIGRDQIVGANQVHCAKESEIHDVKKHIGVEMNSESSSPVKQPEKIGSCTSLIVRPKKHKAKILKRINISELKDTTECISDKIPHVCFKPCLQDKFMKLHKDDMQLKCIHCSHIISDGESLESHKKSHFQNPPHPCQYCGKKCKYKLNIMLHENGSLYENKGLEKNFVPLNVHCEEKEYGENAHQCHFCRKYFQSKQECLLHEKEHKNFSPSTKTKSYINDGACEDCGKVFKHRSSLRLHKKMKHEDSSRWRHLCHLCGKHFPYAYMLNLHMVNHTGERNFLCQMCGKKFSRKENLHMHTQIKHNSSNLRHACDICGERFVGKSHLQVHFNRHHSIVKPYECHWCKRKFPTKSQLGYHERCHTGVLPYTCGICGQNFRYNSNMRMHERTHSQQANYVCEKCGKNFTRQQGLKRHIEKHCKGRITDKEITKPKTLKTKGSYIRSMSEHSVPAPAEGIEQSTFPTIIPEEISKQVTEENLVEDKKENGDVTVTDIFCNSSKVPQEPEPQYEVVVADLSPDNSEYLISK